MATEDNGLSLEGLAKRLQALERENAELRDEVGELRGSGTRRNEEEPLLESERQVSRRQLFSKVGAAAAGLVVAGALTQRDVRPARAETVVNDFYKFVANVPNRGAVEGNNSNSAGYGVWGHDTDNIGVFGTGSTGVQGNGDEWGVYAIGSGPAAGGVYAQNFEGGHGVAGYARSSTNYAVYGSNYGSAAGVYGESLFNDGPGVQGVGKYGGVFQGSQAQLRLAPASTAGKPTTGAHTKGEIYMDSAGSLFVCTGAGTPGTWKKVNMKLV